MPHNSLNTVQQNSIDSIPHNSLNAVTDNSLNAVQNNSLNAITDNSPNTIPHNSLNILTTGLSWPSLQPGGLNTYFRSISEKLAEHNQVQALICGALKPEIPDGRELLHVVKPSDANGHGLFLTNIGDTRMSLQKRRQVFQEQASHIMKQQPIDLLFTHFAPYGLGPALEAKKRNIPIVMAFHGPWSAEIKIEGHGLRHHFKTIIAKNIEKQAYRLADRFVVLSETFRDILHHHYRVPQYKISIIPGAADTKRFQPAKDRKALKKSLGIPEEWIPEGHTVVLTVRRLVNRMGLLQLVDAWQEVVKEQPNVVLLIGGRGPLKEELFQRIRDNGLETKVRLLGYIPDSDLPRFYQAADLFVVPTQSLEGFGLITVEAMASGLPVIATPVGGNKEILQGFRPEMLFNSEKSEDIAAGLLRLLKQRESWPTAEECRSHIMAKYTWEKVAKQVEDVFQQVVEEKRKSINSDKTN